MVDKAFYMVSFFKSLILRMYWPTNELIKDIELPILFVTGKKDEIVPHEQTLKLYDLAEKALFKYMYVTEEGHHNDTWAINLNEYLKTLDVFMDKAREEKSNILRG